MFVTPDMHREFDCLFQTRIQELYHHVAATGGAHEGQRLELTFFIGIHREQEVLNISI